MNERKVSGRLLHMVPMILFVLVFVVCCGTLAGLFLRSADVSARAGQRNAAVQFCRNQAERFRAGEEMPMSPIPFKGGEMTAAVTREECSAGQLLHAEFTAISEDGEILYTLNAARYVSDGR